MRIFSDIGSRVRRRLNRRAESDNRETRQERRIHAALERQEIVRERGKAEGRGF